MVVWHLFAPCKVCWLALPMKEMVFAMAELNALIYPIQRPGDTQGEGVENYYQLPER